MTTYQYGGRSGPQGIIPAIKQVRQTTGMSLKDSKDLVESWG